jgi:hypothetical protein
LLEFGETCGKPVESSIDSHASGEEVQEKNYRTALVAIAPARPGLRSSWMLVPTCCENIGREIALSYHALFSTFTTDNDNVSTSYELVPSTSL